MSHWLLKYLDEMEELKNEFDDWKYHKPKSDISPLVFSKDKKEVVIVKNDLNKKDDYFIRLRNYETGERYEKSTNKKKDISEMTRQKLKRHQ